MLKRCLLFKMQKGKTRRSHAMNTTGKKPRAERNGLKCSLLAAGDNKQCTTFLLTDQTHMKRCKLLIFWLILGLVNGDGSIECVTVEWHWEIVICRIWKETAYLKPTTRYFFDSLRKSITTWVRIAFNLTESRSKNLQNTSLDPNSCSV
jgi:hypothetical protein